MGAALKGLRSEAWQPGHRACNRGDAVYTANPKGGGGCGRYNAMRINDEIKVLGKQKRDLRDQSGPEAGPGVRFFLKETQVHGLGN